MGVVHMVLSGGIGGPRSRVGADCERAGNGEEALKHWRAAGDVYKSAGFNTEDTEDTGQPRRNFGSYKGRAELRIGSDWSGQLKNTRGLAETPKIGVHFSGRQVPVGSGGWTSAREEGTHFAKSVRLPQVGATPQDIQPPMNRYNNSTIER